MAKAEITKKQKSAAKKNTGYTIDLLNAKDSEQVSKALLECIRVGDLDSFRDVLTAHINCSNKLRLAKKAGVGRL